MVEDTEKPRRPAKSSAEQKPMGSRGNAQTAGRRDEARPAARSNSSDRPRGDRPMGRPQGQGEGRPRGDRPQGAPGTGPRGPRPQGSAPAGARPAYGKPAPRQFDDKSDETVGLELTDTGDDVPATRVAHVPKKSDANYSMSYRGSSQKAPSRPNAQNKKNNSSGKPSKAATQRQSMLNTHKLAPFKYDMNEILSQSSMDPGMASSFLASIIAKASRISTKDAKDYAKTFVDDGYLGKEEYDKICKLMDRYSKYR
ncbi:MAG: hypothetical protein J5897_07725 [Candidatus Methanomethylophilus sp.]|nr:hypothetical protein [Methanomethylophilus sp.]